MSTACPPDSPGAAVPVGQNRAMDEFWAHIGITWVQVIGVVVATSSLYLCYAAVLRLLAQRVRSSTSTLSLALATVMGSLVARSMLGDAPTLFGGLVAVTTLVSLEAAFGALRQRLPVRAVRRRHRPMLLLVDGVVRPEELKAARLSERDLCIRLRQQGVRSYGELALVVLETRGTLTVVHAGQRIEARLMADVPGAASLPDTIVKRT